MVPATACPPPPRRSASPTRRCVMQSKRIRCAPSSSAASPACRKPRSHGSRKCSRKRKTPRSRGRRGGFTVLASRAFTRPERKPKMLSTQKIPAPSAGVYTNGPIPVTRHAARQLRCIARELAPPRRRQRRKRRVLYRQNLSDLDVDVIVSEIGIERGMHSLDRLTQPQLSLVAAE